MGDEMTSDHLSEAQEDALRADNLNAARLEAERLATEHRRTCYVVRTDWAEFLAVLADEYECWSWGRQRGAEIVDTYWEVDDPDPVPW
jgi:hypothetical protein